MTAIPTKSEIIERDGKTYRRLEFMCVMCSKPNAVEVLEEEYEVWRRGAFVQEAFPNTSPADRETLISGTHGKCWDEAFGEEDDEESSDFDEDSDEVETEDPYDPTSDDGTVAHDSLEKPSYGS
jgi:hypothetical protein